MWTYWFTSSLQEHYTKAQKTKNNCLVVLQNFFGVGVGRQIFFLKIFFKSESKPYVIIVSLSPNEGANKSTLLKKDLLYKLYLNQF